MKPTNYPSKLYKYRCWNNKFHQNILTKNQLYLASPSDFNDPIDCRIGNNFSLLNTNEKIEDYAKIITRRHWDSIEKMGLNPNDERKRIVRDLKSDMDSVQNSDDENTFEMQDKHFGILSLSGRFDSILMWSHYGNFHKGFCVGFSETKLRDSNLFGKGGPVRYKEEFPAIDPRDNRTVEKSFKQTHTKAKDWKYEEEYRLTKLFYPLVPKPSDRIVTIPDNFMTEIILGLKISKNDKKEITEIAKEKNLDVYQIEKVPFEFKLIKKPVYNIGS